MELSRAALSAYDARLAKQEAAAERYVRERLERFMAARPGAAVAEVREFAIELCESAAGLYGDAASAIAADLYEELAEAAGESVRTAQIDTSDVDAFIEEEVHYQAGKIVDGAPTAFVAKVAQCAADQVARRANQTMRKNAARDGVKYARVPMGGETCTFCAMLASRGFVYHSRSTAGEGNHYHRGCRCKVVPGFAGQTVQGYDPDEWLGRWRAMEEIDGDAGLTQAEKLAAKRRLAGGVNVEIDELTPCLRRVSDGKVLQTRFEKVTPRAGGFGDWEFDWSKLIKGGNEIEALYVEEDDRVQGLVAFIDEPSYSAVYVNLVEAAPFNSPHNPSSSGSKEYLGVGAHLFAQAVKRSYEMGYDGFVVFDAKTNLIDYYANELGATRMGGTQRMYIDEGAAKRLYERYYGDLPR